jgi:hypothetical protein
MITTGHNFKLLMQKNETGISIVVPKEMKKLIAENAKKHSMIDSQYIRLAIVERLEKELLWGNMEGH